ELLPDERELDDRPAERPALLRVGGGDLEGVLRAADRADAELEPAVVEDVERDPVALADLAEDVLRGHAGVLKDQLAGGGAAQADLVLLRAHGEAGRVAI